MHLFRVWVKPMELLDTLLAHDAWTTRQILEICEHLSVDQLDREFDIGHRTLRCTLDHIIHNMDAWSTLMADVPYQRDTDVTVPGLKRRLLVAAEKLKRVASDVADSRSWDAFWTDHLDDPPQQKRFGTAIAHVIIHGAHHRAQLLYMLRLSGVKQMPEGDVFSWENMVGP